MASLPANLPEISVWLNVMLGIWICCRRSGRFSKPARNATDPSEFIKIFWPMARLSPVFVKQVVRRFHAASLISGALTSVSGLSQTGPAGFQLRVLPDQRSGFCARAFA